MREAAKGRVWTGQQAHRRGLVDALGGLDAACVLAAEHVGLGAAWRAEAVELRELPAASSFQDKARQLLSGRDDDDDDGVEDADHAMSSAAASGTAATGATAAAGAAAAAGATVPPASAVV